MPAILLGARGRRRARRALLGAGIACVVAGAAVGLHISGFLHASAVGGANLIRQARQAEKAGQSCPENSTGPAGPQHDKVPGLLEIPSLHLTAPVEDGVGDEVLDDAVGHVHASPWPGQPGTSVLAAHNVTWFSRLDQISPGSEVRYATRCLTYTFRVRAHRVVADGDPVSNTATPSLLLVTCYPLSALYPTSSRYVVSATLIRVRSTIAPARRPAGPQPLTVAAPRALVAQGLGLGQNDAPLGTVRIIGSPSAAWRQSNGPAEAERAALAAYFGVVRSASQERRVWWADLAPGVPVAAAGGLWGGQITGYVSHLDSALDVRGERVLRIRLSAVVTITGSSPGSYRITVIESADSSGRLRITGFRMRPPG